MPDWSQLDELLVCPMCKTRFASTTPGEALRCAACETIYPPLAHGWDLIPANARSDSDQLWTAWDELQANGVVSYEMDPSNNLSVGKRADCDRFNEFCGFSGLVLDIGCGPQSWPAYFGKRDAAVRFLGVDPLAGDRPADYPQLRAIGESLPFGNCLFDHLVFATSLDHAVDPLPPLLEARRLAKVTGQVDVWIGEKDPGAPPPQHSPEWYRQLRVPTGAADPFHLRRLEHDDVESLLADAGLEVVEKTVSTVDTWRRHIFYRAIPCTSSGASSTG